MKYSTTIVCSKIVNKKERKLKKGSGYHLDLFLVGLLVCMGGVFGLPLVTGAAVRSVTHVSALSVFSHKQAPGMKPELSMVREQRVTAFAVHIMIGECIYQVTRPPGCVPSLEVFIFILCFKALKRKIEFLKESS